MVPQSTLPASENPPRACLEIKEQSLQTAKEPHFVELLGRQGPLLWEVTVCAFLQPADVLEMD